MKQILDLLNPKKGTQNTVGTTASVAGLIAVLLGMEGVDPSVKFGMGCVCVIAILGLRYIAHATNRDGSDAEKPYQPKK